RPRSATARSATTTATEFLAKAESRFLARPRSRRRTDLGTRDWIKQRPRPSQEAIMSTGAMYHSHKRTWPLLMERVLRRCSPKARQDRLIAAPAGSHDFDSQSARSVRRSRAATHVEGWTLVALLCGGLALAAFVWRQDISLMITLHQLRSMYGTPNIYR